MRRQPRRSSRGHGVDPPTARLPGVNIYDGSRRSEPGTTATARVVPFAPGTRRRSSAGSSHRRQRYGPRFLHERYRVPVYITENGLSCMDWVQGEGHGRA